MTRSLIFAAFIVCLVLVEARVILNRDHVPAKYVKLHRADPERMHEFRIALKQRNVDILAAKVLDASDPDSINYGKWWTTEQILDLIAPPSEEIDPVVEWLQSNGITNVDASGRDFIKVQAPIGMLEKVFKTEMYNYRSTESGGIVTRVYGPAHVPDHLSIVEKVFGLSELFPLPSGPKSRPIKQRATESIDPMGYIYPGLLRQMYGVPSTYKVHPKSSMGVVQFLYENVLNARSYDPADIGLFNAGMNENIHVDKLVGPFDGARTAYEPTLDTQYGSASALNTTFWYWTEMVWMYEFATEFFNSKSYPLVVSMSYGFPEDGQCTIDANSCNNGGYIDYITRTDTEFMKISMKGVSLLSSSGDQGAPGDNNPFCTSSGGLSNMYPATSPWVTSVGATMLIPGGSSLPAKQPPVCQQMQCATTGLEGVCTFPTSLITTGGGFSSVNTLPTWQQTAVKQYLNSGIGLPVGYFNQSNRGFPDISANGHNYLIQFSPYGFLQIDGTSASTPLVAGMIALLNSDMLNNNKAPLGFLNPLIYKMWTSDATIFTDITSGNNNCTEDCCSALGFSATNGWDPVTGLGTPVFPKMQKYIRNNLIKNKH